MRPQEIKNFLEASYEENASWNIDGYVLDDKLSNLYGKVYVNHDLKKAVLAFRGTGMENLGSYLYHLLYGEFGNESNNYDPFKNIYSCQPKYKTGIEVLGMTPSITKDGKYTFDGLSTVELKNACKMNGIKGYSKCYKLGLVKSLMKFDCIEEPKIKKKIIIFKKRPNL